MPKKSYKGARIYNMDTRFNMLNSNMFGSTNTIRILQYSTVPAHYITDIVSYTRASYFGNSAHLYKTNITFNNCYTRTVRTVILTFISFEQNSKEDELIISYTRLFPHIFIIYFYYHDLLFLHISKIHIHLLKFVHCFQLLQMEIRLSWFKLFPNLLQSVANFGKQMENPFLKPCEANANDQINRHDG